MWLYDPLGPENDRVSSDGASTDALLCGCSAHVFPFRSQISSTSLCGYFALYAAEKVAEHLRTHPRATPEQLDALIVRAFGKSADWGDVATLDQEFGNGL